MATNVDADRNLVAEALRGGRSEDAQRIAEIGIAVVATLVRKNTDYGSSAWRPPVLAPGLPPSQAILVRMSDKIERISSLSKRGDAMVAESLEDTITDLAGYSILYLARPDKDDANGVSSEDSQGQPQHENGRPAHNL